MLRSLLNFCSVSSEGGCWCLWGRMLCFCTCVCIYDNYKSQTWTIDENWWLGSWLMDLNWINDCIAKMEVWCLRHPGASTVGSKLLDEDYNKHYLVYLLISIIFCSATCHLRRRSFLALLIILCCTMLWSILSLTWPYMVQFGIKVKLTLTHHIHTTVHFQPWLMIGDPSGLMELMNSQHLTFLLDLYRYWVQVILIKKGKV